MLASSFNKDTEQLAKDPVKNSLLSLAAPDKISLSTGAVPPPGEAFTICPRSVMNETSLEIQLYLSI